MAHPNNIDEQQQAKLRRSMKRFDLIAWSCFFLFFLVFLYASGVISIPVLMSDKTEEVPVVAEEVKPEDNPDLIVDSIHVRSGLKVDAGYELVVANCGGCHSYKLVTQNNADSAGWIASIRWMQKTQKLWDLGEQEAAIVAYLAKNYGAKKMTRRPNLKNIEWYKL